MSPVRRFWKVPVLGPLLSTLPILCAAVVRGNQNVEMPAVLTCILWCNLYRLGSKFVGPSGSAAFSQPRPEQFRGVTLRFPERKPMVRGDEKDIGAHPLSLAKTSFIRAQPLAAHFYFSTLCKNLPLDLLAGQSLKLSPKRPHPRPSLFQNPESSHHDEGFFLMETVT